MEPCWLGFRVPSTTNFCTPLASSITGSAGLPGWDKGKQVGRARIQAAPRPKDRNDDGSSSVSPLGSLDLGRSDTSVTCRCDRSGERRWYPLVGDVRVPDRAAIENITSPRQPSGRVFENHWTDNGGER